jgi:Heterokaryon incompatibility protein (HET)
VIGSSAAEVISTRALPTVRNTHTTFQRLNNLVSACAENHVQCRTVFINGGSHLPGSGPSQDLDILLPSRVLHVSAGSKFPSIRLLDSNGLKGCYAALSHCWGQSRHLCTTKSTLGDHMKDIPYSQLPRTFQDAITITRRLGLQYLWIDSLCIIQDDNDDWESESAKMGQVYWSAYLTIAAVSSLDGDGGCFHTRGLPTFPPVKLPFSTEDGELKGHWYVCEQPDNFHTSVTEGPLQQRAWTLQERLLSRRMIHFAHDQVYFECKMRLQFENSQSEVDARSFDDLSFLVLFNLIKSGSANTPSRPTYRVILERQWYRIVEDYTKRGLTKPKDKLPALSGLASELAKYTGEQYIAGLWRCNIYDDLLWRTCRYDGPEGMRRGRPHAARTPSWSWASVEGPVLFATAGSGKIEQQRGWGVIEDVVVEVHPLGRDIYGQVRSGTVTMTGPMVRVIRGEIAEDDPCVDWYYSCLAKYFRLIFKHNLFTLLGYEYVRTRDQRYFGTGAFDELADEAETVDCISVKLQRHGKAWDFGEGCFVDSWLVLFLKPTGEKKHEYKRVGMGQLFQCGKREWGETTRITIV